MNKRNGASIFTMPFFKKSKLNKKSKSEVALLKDDIQAYLREIVILRDGGCILRHLQGKIYKNIHIPYCNGYRKDGQLILQADHLNSRSHSETYADSRLAVCVCKGHHGWKSVADNLRKKEYDEIVKSLLPKERVKLWEECESRRFLSYKMGAYDWKLEIVNLKSELEELKKNNT